jgi:hypothetical protein
VASDLRHIAKANRLAVDERDEATIAASILCCASHRFLITGLK